MLLWDAEGCTLDRQNSDTALTCFKPRMDGSPRVHRDLGGVAGYKNIITSFQPPRADEMILFKQVRSIEYGARRGSVRGCYSKWRDADQRGREAVLVSASW